jgi:ferredoxin-nitrite reductase
MGIKVNGEEGYVVNLGGGADNDQGLARELIPAIRFADLPPVMERVMQAFEEKKTSDEETFLAFTRRHSVQELRSFAQWEGN